MHQGADQIGAADDADQPAVLDDRQALDVALLHLADDGGEVIRWSDDHDIARHHLADFAGMRIDIVAGQSSRPDQKCH